MNYYPVAGRLARDGETQLKQFPENPLQVSKLPLEMHGRYANYLNPCREHNRNRKSRHREMRTLEKGLMAKHVLITYETRRRTTRSLFCRIMPGMIRPEAIGFKMHAAGDRG